MSLEKESSKGQRHTLQDRDARKRLSKDPLNSKNVNWNGKKAPSKLKGAAQEFMVSKK